MSNNLYNDIIRIESLIMLIKSTTASKCSLAELFLRIINFAFDKNSKENEKKTSNDLLKLLSKNLVLAREKDKKVFILKEIKMNLKKIL